MITITFNDKTILLESSLSLNEFLTQHTKTLGHYAVALNRKFIAKSHYTHTTLKEGDHIEIIFPMQGG